MKRFFDVRNGSFESLSTPPLKKLVSLRLVGLAAVAGLGVLGTTFIIKSLGYRITHLVVDGGVVNGNVVKLRSPVDGKITRVHARVGTRVKTKEVLARLDRHPSGEQSLLQQELDLKLKLNQLQAAMQSREVQKNRLENLEKQHQLFWETEVTLSADALNKSEAALEASIARANLEKLHYDRHQTLFAEGALPKRKIDELHSAWQSAEASVKEARATLTVARSNLNASKNNLATNQSRHWGESITKEIGDLNEQIQQQSLAIDALKAEITIARARLQNAKEVARDRSELEINSPFAGIVYQAHREQQEPVKQSEQVFSVLDCKDLWVDALVSSRHANSIDDRQPVIVKLAGYNQQLSGKIENKIETLASAKEVETGAESSRVEVLSPQMPSEVEGKPLKPLRVRVSFPPEYAASQQFCGIGNSASLTFVKRLF